MITKAVKDLKSKYPVLSFLPRLDLYVHSLNTFVKLLDFYTDYKATAGVSKPKSLNDFFSELNLDQYVV